MALLKFGKAKKQEQKGRFIVIDGTDGSGKSTQTKLLMEELKVNGYAFEVADFPQYGQPSAVMVEQYLIEKKYGSVNPKAASIFYAIDRFDASFKIRSWLEEGKVVICNRYVTANAAHQGGKISDDTERIKFFRWLDNLEYEIFGIPKPDLNIILHVSAEIAQQLAKEKWKKQEAHMKGKQTDLHEEDIEHLRNAEKVYLEIGKLFPNTKLIECMENDELLTVAEVSNKVWQLVRRMALKDLKQNS
jgi:dTMP kinase